MSIEVKYRKPVPYDTDLFGCGKVVRETGKFIVTRAGIFDTEGNLLADADISYIKLAPGVIAPDYDSHEEMVGVIEDGVSELPFCGKL